MPAPAAPCRPRSGAPTSPPDGLGRGRCAPARPSARAPHAYLDALLRRARDARAATAPAAPTPGCCAGIGRRDGRAIAYAAQTGTATTPAGFRTAARLVRLADRLGLPILTLVDTPGAANDEAAERAGVGAAIADLFAAIAAAARARHHTRDRRGRLRRRARPRLARPAVDDTRQLLLRDRARGRDRDPQARTRRSAGRRRATAACAPRSSSSSASHAGSHDARRHAPSKPSRVREFALLDSPASVV